MDTPHGEKKKKYSHFIITSFFTRVYGENFCANDGNFSYNNNGDLFIKSAPKRASAAVAD